MAGATIRKGEAGDVPALYRLIKELAKYEKEPQEVTLTQEQLLQDGFGPNPYYEFFVADHPEAGVVGIALYYYNYSTWKGMCVYLEDLIVSEAYRGLGLGHALFDAVARFAKAKKANRMMWQVLDWNQPAIDFYDKKLGATLDATWINCKLTAADLQAYPD